MSGNESPEQTTYAVHYTTFCHYSSQLFRARIWIVTVIFLVFAYLLGYQPSEPVKLFGSISASRVVAFLASIVVCLLFRMETAYVRRLVEVANSAAPAEALVNPKRFSWGKPGHLVAIETRNHRPFFSEYKSLPHWPVEVLHVSTIAMLYVLFLGFTEIGATDGGKVPPHNWLPWGLSIPWLLPLALFAETYLNHSRFIIKHEVSGHRGRKWFIARIDRIKTFLKGLWSTPSDSSPEPDADETAASRQDQHRRLVQSSAFETVKNNYLSGGWQVSEQSDEDLGYDLLCQRNQQKLRISVKGTCGDRIGFTLSKPERDSLKSDPDFLLVVVTNALETEPQRHDFSNLKEIKGSFDMTPVMYQVESQVYAS